MTAERTDLAAALGKTALLSGLTPAELKTLAERSVRKLFNAGELLFSEGEPCNGLHIVAQGKTRIFKTSVSGREQVLAVNGPGDSIAELPVFDGGPFPASASAVEDTEIAFISRRDFQAYCLEHPEVPLKVLAVVGGRLRRSRVELRVERNRDSLGFDNGDIVAVVYKSAVAYALVGDIGPSCKIGEGSLRLHEQLGQKACLERDRASVCTRAANHSIERGVLYFIFSGSRERIVPGLTPGNINERLNNLGPELMKKLETH